MKRSQIIVPLTVIGVCAIVYLLNAITPLLLLPKEIAVQAHRPQQTEGIYIFNVLKQDFTRLTPNDVLAYHPVWSPDGQYLAYMHWIDNNEGISLIDKAGGEPEIILSTTLEDSFRLYPTRGGYLTWSPDSQQILFNALSKGRVTLFLLDIYTGQVAQPTIVLDIGSQDSLSFAWSQAGLVIEVGGQIYLVNLETGEATYLVSGTAPFWKPDSETLTYSCKDHGKWYGLCTFSMVRGEKSVLYQPEICCIGVYNGIQWTSDGRFIVYRESSGENDPQYLTILDAQTGRPYRVYRDDWFFIDEVTLVPDEW